MVQLGKDHANTLETFVARPAFVVASSRTWTHQALGKSYSIKVDDLAAALLAAVVNGNSKQTLENADLIKAGQDFSSA